jgi:hypothetical protein
LLYFVIAEAVIVLATSCTSQITSRFMAASFERHMVRSQLSACENLLFAAQAALLLCARNRLNRFDLGAKDDVILTFAVMAHEESG